MAAGWGIRGAFGHSRGAAMPGAMLGLSIAVFSTRVDWWRRAAILGFLGAIGWGFAGTASYGLLIGYSQGGSWTNSMYGYTGLFIVGALYGGIGGALLSMGLTAPRSVLDRYLWPMILLYCVWMLSDLLGWKAWSLELFAKSPERPTETSWLYDTLWLDAAIALTLFSFLWALVPRWRAATGWISLLSLAWFAGMFLLVGVTGFRINPSRGDAWAGCAGMLIAWLLFYWTRSNRAAVLLTCYGCLSGGAGFVVGEFIQALGKAKWGPIGSFPVLQEFGYWTIMEQTLGAMMGLGISLAIIRLVQGNVAVPTEDSPSSWFDSFALFILLGVLFVFNFRTNYRFWLDTKMVNNDTLNLPSGTVLSCVAMVILGLLAFAIFRQRRGLLNIAPNTTLGKAQLLTILLLWMVMAIYMLLPRIGLPTSLMFLFELTTGTFLLLCVDSKPLVNTMVSEKANETADWRLGRGYFLLCVLVPIAIAGIAWLTMRLELPAKQMRF